MLKRCFGQFLSGREFRDLNTLSLSLADLPLFISQNREPVSTVAKDFQIKEGRKRIRIFCFKIKSFSNLTVCAAMKDLHSEILVLQLRPDAAK